MGTRPILLDQQMTERIRDAVNKAFALQLSVDTRNGSALNDDRPTPLEGISAVLDVIQPNARGVFVVSFPEATIRGVLSSFYGRAIAADEPAIDDGLSEIANTIYGQVKTQMFGDGFEFEKVRPRVYRGPGFVVEGDPTRALKVDFTTPYGGFRVSFFPEAVIRGALPAAA